MDKEQIAWLDHKLDLILRIMAMEKLQGKTQTEQVKMLTELGLRPSEISSVTGIDIHTITARLAERKKSRP